MPDRTTPYGAFNFLVNMNGPVGPDEPLGGFADVSGLSTDVTIAEYRNGNDREKHVRKVPGLHKVSDVTLKRGVINSRDLWEWMQDVRNRGAAAQRTVTVTLQDETFQPVQVWILRGCVPLRFTGPTLSGKGGGDVAMEELVLSVEGLDLDQVA
jgi:phage tail-like protein